MLSRQRAAVLEALCDERLAALHPGEVPSEVRAQLGKGGIEVPGGRTAAEQLLQVFRAERVIEWATRTVTQGELLAAFADHCDLELDEVDVLERSDDVLVASWRRERSRLELRAGLLGLDRLVSDTPTMLLSDLEGSEEQVVRLFLDDVAVRSRLAVCDLARLERVGAVRSSVFVYFEWFLRDAYGVKLLPAAAFTQGLIDRGVISLGMG